MPEKLGRYEILEKIGRGGFAVVYRAHDTVLDRLVALKELKPMLLADPDSVKAFRREARHIAHLDHPNVVTIYDVYEAQQRQFIVMQVVDGSSLEERIASQGRLSWSNSVEIITAVAAGLDYAHDRGILHRDLKPANVLLDSTYGPMLSDFGLAKLIGEVGTSVTTGEVIVGTPHYIAPEVWEGQRASPQSDIYALGCILYEMLTSEKLFAGETPPAVMSAHFKPLALPASWPEGVPSGVADVLTIALAQKPGDRYATAAEMTKALTGRVQSKLSTPQLEPVRLEARRSSPPILTTKLYIPPIRPESVSRPRLIEQLNRGFHLERKLTLVSAPAGFGKTTLVSDWLQQLDASAAWVSLDESDNDPTRFLTYFITALQKINPAIGQAAQAMLQSPQLPPLEALMTTLINNISTTVASTQSILVLDDYHLIEAQPIHDGLTFLLDHLPPPPGGVQLVVVTREDPPLPLARLRVRSQLTELRAADLRFTASEAAEFLNRVMGLTLSAEDTAALENRTEGWIAGLQLAALSMKNYKDAPRFIQSFTGSHRFILDYLTEEILDQQPTGVQHFLLQTSILNRLTGALCDALTGQDNGRATLKMLERANLFLVPLDEARRWYRYHHLFADLLRQRLRQTQPERLPVLHRRASEWHHQNGFAEEAIEYALRGQDFERAADIIESQFGDNYERVNETILRRWLADMPEDFVLSNPHLCVFQAWTLFTTGQLDVADQSLQAAEKLLAPTTNQGPPVRDQLSDIDRMKLLGRIATIRAFSASYRGQAPAETVRYARQALKFLPEHELSWRSTALIALGDAYAGQGQMAEARRARSEALMISKESGDSYLLMIVNLRLAEILRQQGELQQVINICERQFKTAEASGLSESAITGWLLGIWAEVLAELNHLERALDYAKKGVKLSSGGKDVLYEVMSTLCLARVLFSGRDVTAAEAVVQSMEDKARDYNFPHWAMVQVWAWQARLWLAQGNLTAVSRWVAARGFDLDGEPTYLHEMEHIALARIFMAQGRLAKAARLLQRLLDVAEAGGRTSRVIEVLNLQAMLLHAQEETDQAVTTLEQALILAEPGGFVRVFVDEGPPMARLLYDALKRGIAPDYVQRLLAAFPLAEPEPALTASSKSQQPANSELIEPLSERELEVLQLIANGLTNQEIASTIFVTLNTVKAHAHNIYGKLNVNNRTQAVARARDLGILPLD